MEEEKLCNKLEQARGPNVPPECDTRMTIGSFISNCFGDNGNPILGIDNSCPNRSLLLDTVLMYSLGKHFDKSAANCSATQRDTSQPVMRMST
jgi:hypothetical protein